MRFTSFVPVLLLASVKAQDAATTSQDALNSYLSRATLGISILAQQSGFEELVSSAESELSFLNAVTSAYPERYSEFNSIAALFITNPGAVSSALESISAEVTLPSVTSTGPISTGTAVTAISPGITASATSDLVSSATGTANGPSQISVSGEVSSIVASASEAAESILASASEAADMTNGVGHREVKMVGVAGVATAIVLGLAVLL